MTIHYNFAILRETYFGKTMSKIQFDRSRVNLNVQNGEITHKIHPTLKISKVLAENLEITKGDGSKLSVEKDKEQRNV